MNIYLLRRTQYDCGKNRVKKVIISHRRNKKCLIRIRITSRTSRISRASRTSRTSRIRAALTARAIAKARAGYCPPVHIRGKR